MITGAMLRVGIPGVGSIGRTLAAALDENRVDADANPRISPLVAFWRLPLWRI